MSNAPSRTAKPLTTPVQFVSGVRPAVAERLARLNVHTVADLLFHFPRDYHDLSDERRIEDLEEGRPMCVRGVVEETELKNTSTGRSLFGVLVRQQQQQMRAIWFNQPYMQDKVRRGQHVLLFGKARFFGGRWEMSHPRVEILDDDQDDSLGRLQPIYPATANLSQHQIRRAARAALDEYVELLDEVFSEQLLKRYQLLPLKEALPAIHFPPDRAALDAARHRLVFQELFVLQLALGLRRHEQREQLAAPALPPSAKIDARITRLFPFELTAGQKQVIAEIAADMAQTKPMNRLLQGEVGSGKTVVAQYAMMLCVAHGYQAALMAPTEILARQHFQTVTKALAASRVRCALLTGAIEGHERDATLAAIAGGQIDLVVGTQAMVQNDVQFSNLALTIIDEQHKFGVRQRAALRKAGTSPHYLVMTATPIPRTISMTVFGDLDISTLRDRPPGRQEVHTYLVAPEQQDRWWEFVRKKLREGRQAFVITPLVDESEQFDLDNAEASLEHLANGPLEAFRLDLVHGRMSAADKERAMQAFRDGKTQVLVSTSIVEVGVDVPNATVITIQGAQHFGLAQLHQLRGRVSRGTTSGYCGLLADPSNDQARARLEAVAQSSDGFKLAELDFQMRGPGDLLGTQQHGLPSLRIADLQRDTEQLGRARREARTLLQEDPGLNSPDHARLRRMVEVRYGKALNLGDVG